MSSATTTSSAGAAVLCAGDMSATVTSVSEVQPLTNVFVPLETIQPGDFTVAIISKYTVYRVQANQCC